MLELPIEVVECHGMHAALSNLSRKHNFVVKFERDVMKTRV